LRQVRDVQPQPSEVKSQKSKVKNCFFSFFLFIFLLSSFTLHTSYFLVTSLDRTIMTRQSDIGCSPILRNRTFPLFQFCAGQLAIASLFAMAIPSRPALAFTEFQICTAELVRLAAVSQEAASVACSDALNPKDLSRCVVTIHLLTPTLTQDALVACTKVRRPVELSRCVSDISNKTRDTEPTAVLGYCRRSLLPLRYSECVVGLSRETDIPASRAMNTCIEAEDFPRDFSPAFAPPPPPNPTLPRSVPNIAPEPIPTTPVTPNVPANPVNPQRKAG
jgi:hypothetical protein